jgi:Spy/CpxP family protein refolding chaperone
MNKQRTLIVLAVAALLALAAGSALAQGPRGRHGGGFPDGDGIGAERLAWLDLSEDQRKAVDGILDQARQEGVELRKEQARLRNQIQGEMLADQPSESRLIELTEEMGALRTQLQVIRLKARLAVRAQLSEEQRDQLMLRGDRLGRGGPHRGRAPRAPGEHWHQRRLRFLEQQESEDGRI